MGRVRTSAHKTIGRVNFDNSRVTKGTGHSRNVRRAHGNHALECDDFGQRNPASNRMHQTTEVNIAVKVLRTEIEVDLGDDGNCEEVHLEYL